MTSPGELQARREEKKARRDKRKAALAEESKNRAKKHQAPDHGITESDLLRMRVQVAELTKQGNQMLKKLEQFDAQHLEARALEGYFLSRSIADRLVAKGILTPDELIHSSTNLQLDALGLADKADHPALEIGDVALIELSLWHEGQLVDDQTKEPLGYQMGSRQLPCEDQMLGMVKSEERSFDVTFGEGFKFEHLVGKPVQIKMKLLTIKTAPAPQGE